MASSLFDKLPGEIRNHIYEFALTVPGEIVLELSGRPNKKVSSQARMPRVVASSNLKLHLGLLATCKSIKKEASPIFLAENHFKILAHRAFMLEEANAAVEQTTSWYLARDPTRAHLKHLEISFGEAGTDQVSSRAAFIERFMSLMRASNMHPSLTLDLDVTLCAIGTPSNCILKIDFTGKTVSENQKAIEIVVADAKILVETGEYSWEPFNLPWMAPSLANVPLLSHEILIVKWIGDEGKEIRRFVQDIHARLLKV